MADLDHIQVRGARENNLRDVSLDIPKRAIAVFTGVSGSGKSSLVFGTIAAESQRLINETYTALIQSFMPNIPRPDVDSLRNLSAAILVDQERMGAIALDGRDRDRRREHRRRAGDVGGGGVGVLHREGGAADARHARGRGARLPAARPAAHDALGRRAPAHRARDRGRAGLRRPRPRRADHRTAHGRRGQPDRAHRRARRAWPDADRDRARPRLRRRGRLGDRPRPGAGRDGGAVVYAGPPRRLLEADGSLTGRHLSEHLATSESFSVS